MLLCEWRVWMRLDGNLDWRCCMVLALLPCWRVRKYFLNRK
jgi:hypothetical protein